MQVAKYIKIIDVKMIKVNYIYLKKQIRKSIFHKALQTVGQRFQ